MLCVLEGGEGCLSLCQPVCVPLYKAQWTDRMSYGSDALVTAVALKYTVAAESALSDSHRYSRSSSPLATLLSPRFTSSCGKLKPLHLLSADPTVFSSLVSFGGDRCYFLGSIFPASGAQPTVDAATVFFSRRGSSNVPTFSLEPISDSATLI